MIDELWGLQFGNGVNGGDPGTLYFTAGIGEEEHGLFGSLKPTTASATSLIQFATDQFVIGEGTGFIDVSVTRAGDASGIRHSQLQHVRSVAGWPCFSEKRL